MAQCTFFSFDNVNTLPLKIEHHLPSHNLTPPHLIPNLRQHGGHEFCAVRLLASLEVARARVMNILYHFVGSETAGAVVVFGILEASPHKTNAGTRRAL